MYRNSLKVLVFCDTVRESTLSCNLENVSKNIENHIYQNEVKDKTNTTRESNGLITSDCFETKQLTTSSSSPHHTTSSTEPSVVRNIIENGTHAQDHKKNAEVIIIIHFLISSFIYDIYHS